MNQSECLVPLTKVDPLAFCLYFVTLRNRPQDLFWRNGPIRTLLRLTLFSGSEDIPFQLKNATDQGDEGESRKEEASDSLYLSHTCPSIRLGDLFLYQRALTTRKGISPTIYNSRREKSASSPSTRFIPLLFPTIGNSF